jgi:N-acetylneuraminate synthase/N,N'-diacetyllegionaminate synthase
MSQSAMTELGYGDLYERMADFELTIDQYRELRDYCRQHEISFLSTPFSIESVDLLDSIDVPAIKIGSGEFSNSHLIRTAADTGLPLVISTGMSSWDDIETQIPFIDRHADTFALLYCVSAYPTQPEDLNLGVIKRIHESFDVPIGLSGHSTRIRAAVTAIGFGASLIEKHFTIDRRLPGGDQEVSIEPDELDELTDYADLAVTASGQDREILDAEQDIKEWAVHSAVTTERIESGEQLRKSNPTTKRPGTGVPTKNYYEILGCEVSKTIEADSVISHADI